MKKSVSVCVGVLIGFIFLFPIMGATAGQCHIVRIAKETRDGDSRIWLYPSEIRVPQGTCLIWVNWVEKEAVNINFGENSKSCMIATEALSGFKSIAGCFISDTLLYGQTVSLHFKEKGNFSYKLEIYEKELKQGLNSNPKIILEGAIVVE